MQNWWLDFFLTIWFWRSGKRTIWEMTHVSAKSRSAFAQARSIEWRNSKRVEEFGCSVTMVSFKNVYLFSFYLRRRETQSDRGIDPYRDLFYPVNGTNAKMSITARDLPCCWREPRIQFEFPTQVSGTWYSSGQLLLAKGGLEVGWIVSRARTWTKHSNMECQPKWCLQHCPKPGPHDGLCISHVDYGMRT